MWREADYTALLPGWRLDRRIYPELPGWVKLVFIPPFDGPAAWVWLPVGS
jgi:hypothetical protein